MTDLHTENARLRAALADLVAGGNRQLAIISSRVKHTDPMTLIVTKGQMLEAMKALATPAPDAVQEAARVPEIAALIEAARNLVCHDGWGTVNYTDNGMWLDAETLRAAFIAIAGDRT